VTVPIPVAIFISAVTRSACGVRTAFGLGADVPAYGVGGRRGSPSAEPIA